MKQLDLKCYECGRIKNRINFHNLGAGGVVLLCSLCLNKYKKKMEENKK